MARRETWRDRAERCVAKLHAELDVDSTYDQRKAALRSGYPFSERKGYRYKVWLEVQREYLSRNDDRPLTPDFAPLFFVKSHEK